MIRANFHYIFKEVCNKWDQLTFKKGENDKEGTFTFTANVVAEDYFDDSILFRVELDEQGRMDTDFIFDKIQPSLSAYTLINDLNNNIYGLKAYINDKGYLCLSEEEYRFFNEDEAIDEISNILNYLLNDRVLRYLQPLTELTVSE